MMPEGQCAMRAANVIAGVAITIWFALALAGRGAMDGIIAQRVLGYPNTGQISLYVFWPLFVVNALLFCAWICNALNRGAVILALLSGASIVALLPYLVISGGGV
jgi:hypothetical protein